jgi:hypothetical protein
VLEFALRGDDSAAATLLASAVRAGIKLSSFAPAASDLEELFLQITDTAAAERAAAARVAVNDTGSEVAA